MKITTIPTQQISPPQPATPELRLRVALLISASLEHFLQPDNASATKEIDLAKEPY